MQIDLGYDMEFRMSGTMTAIHNEAQYEYYQDQVASLRSDGYKIELLSPQEALAIEPQANGELLGYVHTSQRGQADPVKSTRAFAHAAENGRGEDSYRTECHRHHAAISRRLFSADRIRRVSLSNVGSGNWSLVRPGWKDVGTQHTNRADTRSNVGYEEFAPHGFLTPSVLLNPVLLGAGTTVQMTLHRRTLLIKIITGRLGTFMVDSARTARSSSAAIAKAWVTSLILIQQASK